MKTEQEIRDEIKETPLYLWGTMRGYGIREEDFAQVCALTRELGVLTRQDEKISKETVLLLLDVLHVILNNAIDVSHNEFDLENMHRRGVYYRILVEELFV